MIMTKSADVKLDRCFEHCPDWLSWHCALRFCHAWAARCVFALLVSAACMLCAHATLLPRWQRSLHIASRPDQLANPKCIFLHQARPLAHSTYDHVLCADMHVHDLHH